MGYVFGMLHDNTETTELREPGCVCTGSDRFGLSFVFFDTDRSREPARREINTVWDNDPMPTLEA